MHSNSSLLVIGGTSYGMETAISCARDGWKVTLITSLSYPGEDTLGTLSSCVQSGAPCPAEQKRRLLNALLEAGVQVLFYTRFVFPLLCNGMLCGALLSGPAGLEEIHCSAVLDATTLGESTFALCGKRPVLKKGTPIVLRQGLCFPQEVTELPKTEGYSFVHDCADACRMQVYKTVLLPMDCTPSQARLYMATQRAEMLRLLHRQMPEGTSDTVVPLSLEVAPQSCENVPLAGWYRNKIPDAIAQQTENANQALVFGQARPYHGIAGLIDTLEGVLTAARHDVLVVGSGTAGAWAALCAMEQGADTLVIEQQSCPGGTRTLGGVTGLYCGNRNGLFAQMWEKIRMYQVEMLENEKISPVPETLFYTEALGENLLCCQKVFCTQVKNGRISSVFSVGEDGLLRYRASQYIDATGDGQLCALAGCDFEDGAPETHMAQNASQWNRCTEARKGYRPVDQDVFLPSQGSEWQRCQKQNLLNANEYDLYPFLTSREARRVRGCTTITLADVASGLRTPDTLYDAYSTYDPHGRCFHMIGRLGAMPALGHGRFASVPLGALLPRQVNGLFVVGKAISADQEAANYLRMNADVMCIGWIAGYMAAKCADAGTDAQKMNWSCLRSFLLQKGALCKPVPEKADREVTAFSLCTQVLAGEDNTVFSLIAQIHPDGLDTLVLSGLENHMASNKNLAYMVLLLYKNTLGAQQLTSQLDALVQKNGPLVYNDRQRNTGVIRGGIQHQADDYWQMNRLAVLLAFSGWQPAIPVIGRMLAYTVPGGGWFNDSSVYSSIRLDCNTIPNYDRILCLATACTLLPDKSYLPLWQKLFHELAVLTPPKAQIWRDYLLLSILEAIKKYGDWKSFIPQANFDLSYYIEQQWLERLEKP